MVDQEHRRRAIKAFEDYLEKHKNSCDEFDIAVQTALEDIKQLSWAREMLASRVMSNYA